MQLYLVGVLYHLGVHRQTSYMWLYVDSAVSRTVCIEYFVGVDVPHNCICTSQLYLVIVLYFIVVDLVVVVVPSNIPR